MNAYIKYIGVIDHNGKLHYVPFSKGLNIITGKSSTGKSAMIEIFDYCFGSSEFTVPEGVITDVTDLYFTIMVLGEAYLVLARKPYRESKKIYIKVESSIEIEKINLNYFDEDYFLSESNFKLELGHYFGIDIDDTDIDLQERENKNQKNPRPSVRNFMSFILQHQNLIANKHSIFYRFDEKEKREQTIEQFKIFMGFVDQNYFVLMQNLNEYKRKMKSLEKEEEKILNYELLLKNTLENSINRYQIITGNNLFEENIDIIFLNPRKYLDIMKDININIDYKDNTYINKLKVLKQNRDKIFLEKRELENKEYKIDTSIYAIEKYKNDIKTISDFNLEVKSESICPFCNSKNNNIELTTNELNNAFDWLNLELKKTPYLLDSFVKDKNLINKELKEKEIEIDSIIKEINEIESISKKLKEKESLEKQALKLLMKIESMFDDILINRKSDIEKKKDDLRRNISNIIDELEEKYSIENKIKKAEKYINKYMNKIGEKLDFEKTYKPINLKFSLSSFDLWHEKENKKIYLRSMGSGANWLYSHICLFLALQNYFCYNNKSMIPPILLLDQPSQVYFPNSIDFSDTFDYKVLSVDLNKNEIKADEDLDAVTNLFNILDEHCINTFEECNILPQIIVTDHADNLKMKDNNFDKLVNGRRWRKRGFIHPID